MGTPPSKTVPFSYICFFFISLIANIIVRFIFWKFVHISFISMPEDMATIIPSIITAALNMTIGYSFGYIDGKKEPKNENKSKINHNIPPACYH